jgi:hypothetical protein
MVRVLGENQSQPDINVEKLHGSIPILVSGAHRQLDLA